MIETRLTKAFNLSHPILSAPMASAGGGALAAAVSGAGGLGLIGGAYGDPGFVAAQFEAAGNQGVGIGFITWALAKSPQVLDQALGHAPRALMLSFGDPAPLAARIAQAGVPLICQVQSFRDACHAADQGAAVIVAQGAEAGGHGEKRATFTLVPEVADWLAKNAPDVILVAAGGIADGRGLAAALMLGAEGALVGSRLWASSEALVPKMMHSAALAATGDQTIRSTVMDVARGLDWPGRYTCRVLKNRFTKRWHSDPEALKAEAALEGPLWQSAFKAGDPEGSNTFVGEVAGLIHDIEPAGEIVARLSAEAEALLSGGWRD